jgi:hypothetical protein
MDSTQIPPEDHGKRPVSSRFDAICSEVQDFEHLPTVTTVPAPPAEAVDEETRTAPLDGQILAGLVSP